MSWNQPQSHHGFLGNADGAAVEEGSAIIRWVYFTFPERKVEKFSDHAGWDKDQ